MKGEDWDLVWEISGPVKKFRVLKFILKEFQIFFAFDIRTFYSSAFRSGPQTESVYSLPPGFSKTEFLKSIFEKAICTNAEDNKNDIPDLQALPGPPVSGIQTQEVKF